jgi:hypothetical protein
MAKTRAELANAAKNRASGLYLPSTSRLHPGYVTDREVVD